MATTSPARIDDQLYASAKLVGEVQSRSASQQVAHWARLGREIEASGTISVKDVAAVLSGSRSYDDLSAEEQAAIRAEWSVLMDRRRETLDLEAMFTTAGRTWVELDDEGNVVERGTATSALAAAPRREGPTRATGRSRSAAKDPAPKGPTRVKDPSQVTVPARRRRPRAAD